MRKSNLLLMLFFLFSAVSCTQPIEYIEGEVELFGINLKEGKQLEFRDTLDNMGAPIKTWKKDPFADVYNPEKLLEGSWLLKIFYLEEGDFCMAEYQVRQIDGDKIEEFLIMLESKYGPCSERGRGGISYAEYTWRFRDGIQINLINTWSNNGIRIEYINTNNMDKLAAQQKASKIEIAKEKGKVQSNAF